MKKTFFLLAALLPAALCATSSHDNATDLIGVWQQVQTSKTDGHLMQLPVWKVMQKDGTFCTFLIANEHGQSVITNQGRFTVVNDSTVTEHINGSITDPELVGKENRITYHFDGKDKIHVSYRMPGATRDGQEDWVRVKLEMPRR